MAEVHDAVVSLALKLNKQERATTTFPKQSLAHTTLPSHNQRTSLEWILCFQDRVEFGSFLVYMSSKMHSSRSIKISQTKYHWKPHKSSHFFCLVSVYLLHGVILSLRFKTQISKLLNWDLVESLHLFSENELKLWIFMAKCFRSASIASSAI